MPSRPNSVQDLSPKSSCAIDEDSNAAGARDEDASVGGRASSSSSSSTGSSRRNADSARRSSDEVTHHEPKRAKLEEETVAVVAPPRLRLNASLATDPALRPQVVAALTIKPENAASPPHSTPALSQGLQNGTYIF